MWVTYLLNSSLDFPTPFPPNQSHWTFFEVLISMAGQLLPELLGCSSWQLSSCFWWTIGMVGWLKDWSRGIHYICCISIICTSLYIFLYDPICTFLISTNPTNWCRSLSINQKHPWTRVDVPIYLPPTALRVTWPQNGREGCIHIALDDHCSSTSDLVQFG